IDLRRRNPMIRIVRITRIRASRNPSYPSNPSAIFFRTLSSPTIYKSLNFTTLQVLKAQHSTVLKEDAGHENDVLHLRP
ncbi:MAG: hypothetical protein KBT27_14120, partial [Prevotellaceae bacterium]|nr:hypothetical protein [Candidatus Faecinaster equi]